MGILNKLTEKCACDICGKSGNKLLMQTLIDGRICNDCFNKLGDNKFATKFTLKQVMEKIEYQEKMLSNSDIDYPFPDTESFYEMLQIELQNAKKLKTNLLEASYPEPASKTEAIYRGRIYSISGKDKRFPALPINELRNTRIDLYPFLYGISEPLHCKPGQEIKYSNRPFIDTRNNKEKEEYGSFITEFLSKEQNAKDYEWILNNLPEIAPKSLSGYSRMKNSKSKNFIKIVEAASKLGYNINM